jgi:hypothetical protein
VSTPEPSRTAELTTEEWLDLKEAYTYGTLDPEPGSIEAEAFAEMDARNRAEAIRVAEEAEADRAYSEASAAERAVAEAEFPEPEPEIS